MFDQLSKTEAARRHKTREIDKLLIVAAPSERVILACLLVFMLAIVIWLVAGSVERTVSFDGVLYRPAPDYEWQVSLLATPVLARAIESGTQASVEFTSADSQPRKLQGEVAPPADVPLNDSLAIQLPWPGTGARRIDIAIAPPEAEIKAAAEGSPCIVSISLGRHTIASLLAFRPT